jgi:hypothetical protein
MSRQVGAVVAKFSTLKDAKKDMKDAEKQGGAGNYYINKVTQVA